MKTKASVESSKAGTIQSPQSQERPAISNTNAADLATSFHPGEYTKPSSALTDTSSKQLPNPVDSSSTGDGSGTTLWDEAYTVLWKKDAKLIEAYEKDLWLSQDEGQEGILALIILLAKLEGRNLGNIVKRVDLTFSCRHSYIAHNP